MSEPRIRVYPKHDDYGKQAKTMEAILNWWYEENKSIIEETARIEIMEMMLYPRGGINNEKV